MGKGMGLGDITRLKQNDITLEKFRHRLMQEMSAKFFFKKGGNHAVSGGSTSVD
jgi:hypothetical protein